MPNIFGQTITDLDRQAAAIARGRYGMIEAAGGRVVAIHLRPLPRVASLVDVLVSGRLYHRFQRGDRAFVYYNQPRKFPNFLAVPYVLSTGDCTLASMYAAVAALDRVAEIKRADALLVDVWNLRVSARLLARAGWEPHKPSRWHRHYIKRFYGVYPARRPVGEPHRMVAAEPALAGLADGAAGG